MEIKEIIDPTIIKTNLDGKTKDEVLYELANRLYEQEYITDVEAFVKDIYLREAQGQTGIGNYIAIPHGKSAYVKKVGVAIGVTENEIPWETLDGKGVKGIILFAVGDDTEGAQKHLKLLSLFARKLGNDEVVERLIAAREIDEVVAAFG
ncbi:fructose PTS transporter subunit IIA [Enterococcus mundtii]|uniref:PTS fructose transporter subunit IIA n=1 Tax=Enterococcus mundtii TaxID=53346 RepID=A0A2S7RRJ9_ENTMU|nr:MULTISPECIES: fructose PTS transporter subunit IIA [Enterococcus]AZP93909.1 PTS fructose transporter subunit IIA [Enterococcus mundtii]EYT94359.1 PTS fructose transporter subunit IIA [Enterococcus mundtii CRL35]MBO1086198.1 PTS fructose transporter subunit IIA [Enterococcus mundtii]MDA9429301.1 PTS system, fructose-specific IIA component [Enterococcus mundtii 1A]MDA9462730.1 PTS system, fructose-specific IIA component [Enterococcus mundtii 3F]